MVRFGIGFALVLTIALAGWLVIAGAPTGGEPVVIASIPPQAEVAIQPDGVPMRSTVPPETAFPGEQPIPDRSGGRSPASIRIIDPHYRPFGQHRSLRHTGKAGPRAFSRSCRGNRVRPLAAHPQWRPQGLDSVCQAGA